MASKWISNSKLHGSFLVPAHNLSAGYYGIRNPFIFLMVSLSLFQNSSQAVSPKPRKSFEELGAHVCHKNISENWHAYGRSASFSRYVRKTTVPHIVKNNKYLCLSRSTNWKPSKFHGIILGFFSVQRLIKRTVFRVDFCHS